VTITGPLCLPRDVMLTPVGELPAATREKLRSEDGDFALTRSRSRTPSRIIDARFAEFIREFSQPTTFVKAVIRFSRARGVSAEETFEEAFPLFERLVAGGFLVAEADIEGPDAPLRIGDTLGRWLITATINVMNDIEVHQARCDGLFAALKVERSGPKASAAARMREREARILRALEGTVAPVLLEQTGDSERSFLAIEWCPGVDAATYAADLRKLQDRTSLLDLCRKVVRIYAELHARGFIHGDVHLRNILVTAQGVVRLIDFGYGTEIAAPEDNTRHRERLERGGVGFFFEPELAAAALRGQSTLAPTPAGEQYAVAALLYTLITGTQYLEFSLERDELLKQIVSGSPVPFAERGVEPWCELEEILARGLRKSAAHRYPSMAAMLEALLRVPAAPRPRLRDQPTSKMKALLGDVDRELRASLTRELTVPKCSLFYGAGGVALALYRLALLRDAPIDLALADAWLARAEQHERDPEGFLDPPNGLTETTVGPVSIYHSPTGLAAVRALVAHAQCNENAMLEASTRLVTLAGQETNIIDLASGRAGALLATALAGDVLPAGGAAHRDLARCGESILDALWADLDRAGPLQQLFPAPNFGMAHGWCGYAFATLRFCRTFERPHPTGLRRRLEELLTVAEPWGRGLRWPWSSGGNAGTMPGWCNGSAGFVQLFVLAHLVTDDRRFLEAATGAAWNTWEGGAGNGSLCCGEAGRAYALISLSRRLGGHPLWLDRARALGERAATSILANTEQRLSLFKGRLGVALLAAEFEKPEAAAFPFLEDEGWS
jgi:serine/threonine protein kinase